MSDLFIVPPIILVLLLVENIGRSSIKFLHDKEPLILAPVIPRIMLIMVYIYIMTLADSRPALPVSRNILALLFFTDSVTYWLKYYSERAPHRNHGQSKRR